MDVFDVRVYAIRHRPDRRRPFEVRWHAAGRTRSRSFITKRLADSYRAELVRAARQGLEFGPASALGWLERASLPIQHLRDPRIIRLALGALAVRLDGRPAAANTIARKRAVFHSALAYAAELGLLPSNPLDQVQWMALPPTPR